MVKRRQGAKAQMALRAAGIPANVTQKDDSGVFVAEIWADTEDIDAPPTKPAKDWVALLQVKFPEVCIHFTEDIYANWRREHIGQGMLYVLCAVIYFSGIDLVEVKTT